MLEGMVDRMPGGGPPAVPGEIGSGELLHAVPQQRGHAAAPEPVLSAGDLAYLAGVLDTRAVVRVRYTEDSATALPYIAMSSGDAALMSWLGQITGVRSIVTSRRYDKHRCLEHCDKAHDHITSVSGRWSLTGVRATLVLLATREWIRFHVEDWEKGIEAGETAGRKAATVRKMTALGWPVPIAWGHDDNDE